MDSLGEGGWDAVLSRCNEKDFFIPIWSHNRLQGLFGIGVERNVLTYARRLIGVGNSMV